MGTVDLYLRKSNQDGRRSVERQLSDLTRDAEAEGLAVGLVFVDPDLSASRFARRPRPDYQALLEYIRGGSCRVLGIVEASRGSRTLTEWSALLDLCRSLGVRIWVQTHGRVYDLSRRRDWRTLADEGLDAADESERLSERVLSGKLQAALQGRPSGKPLYGYVRHYGQDGRLREVVPHPTEAPIVVELIERVAAGESLRSIASDLTARDVRTASGRPWIGTLVRQAVIKPSYAGLRVHRGAIVGEAMWPALVSADVWRRACAVLSAPDRRTHTRGTVLAHWLANAVECGRCGGQLAHNTGGRKERPNYLCHSCGRNAAAAPTLERVIEAAILARWQRRDARALFRPRTTPPAALRRAEAALEALRADAEVNDHAYRAGEISARLAGLREAELATQIARAEAEVTRLTMPPELADLANVDIPAVWHDLNPSQRRAVTRRMAHLVLAPAQRRGPVFDPRRLDGSRWTGDARTWGEYQTLP